MDIRGPRLRKPSDGALAFTSSMASDERIARHVIRVNLAHTLALFRAKEIDRSVAAKCVRFLQGPAAEIDPQGKAEDFHQQLEQRAVDALGVKTAGFLNYGKSRNDQVATAIRMELRLRILDLAGAIFDLQAALLKLAKRDGETIFPGYTHLQRAQPVTLAHHLFAYFDAFQRDSERLMQLYPRVNLSPMGSAALAGTSVALDRAFVAESLGFLGPARNAMDAVSSRDTVVEALSCATLCMLDAGRLAEELILWSSKEFAFVELDDTFAASSSIMPQKKNPVAAELVRAKAGSSIGALVAVCAILKALPYSYNLDLQEATPHLWRAFDDSIDSVKVLTGMISTLKVDQESTRKAVAGDGSTAVALANFLAKSEGISFREAHSIVGELVKTSIAKGIPLEKAAATRLGPVSAKFGRKLRIDEVTARQVLDPENFLKSISTVGGSNPTFIDRESDARRKELSSNRASRSRLISALGASDKGLSRLAAGLAREVRSKG